MLSVPFTEDRAGAVIASDFRWAVLTRAMNPAIALTPRFTDRDPRLTVSVNFNEVRFGFRLSQLHAQHP